MIEFLSNNYQWLIGLLIGGGVEKLVYRPFKFKMDEKKVINVLERTTGKGRKFDWRTTRSLASDANLTKERVYTICAKSKRIKESKGDQEGLWSLRVNPSDSYNKELIYDDDPNIAH